MVRNGTYYHRVKVPRDIVDRYGKRIEVVSLRTKDPKVAKARNARMTADLNDRFESLRTGANPEKPSAAAMPLSAAQVAVIARAHAAAVQERLLINRVELFEAATAEPQRLWSGELIDLPDDADGERFDPAFAHLVEDGELPPILAYLNRFELKRRMKELRIDLKAGNLQSFVAMARDEHGVIDRATSIRLAQALAEAEIDVLEAFLAGRSESAPAAAAIALLASADTIVQTSSPQSAASASPPVALETLFDRWSAETKPAPNTVSTWKGVVRGFRAHIGSGADDIRSIEPAEVLTWKDALLAAGDEPKTVNGSKLACLNALFNWAVRNRLIQENPAKGIKAASKVQAGSGQLPYTDEEVGAILELARAEQRPFVRWLPWLAAATGARIGELAQMHVEQVDLTGKIPVLHIRPASDGGRLKTAESERSIPVHSSLVKEGFLEFVRSKGTGPLFYGRSSGDPTKKHASKSTTSQLAKWIRSKGFRDERKAPNHAFRHWFKSAAARAGIQDSMADAIQGHVTGGSANVYRHFDISGMAAAIEKIRLPVDLLETVPSTKETAPH